MLGPEFSAGVRYHPIDALLSVVSPLGYAHRNLSPDVFEEVHVRKTLPSVVVALAVLVLLPSISRAQSNSGIAGVVKDTTGSNCPTTA